MLTRYPPKANVVLQVCPWQRVIILANAQETAERDDSVSHLAVDFVEHNALHASDLLVVGVIQGSSFNLVASDE